MEAPYLFNLDSKLIPNNNGDIDLEMERYSSEPELRKWCYKLFSGGVFIDRIGNSIEIKTYKDSQNLYYRMMEDNLVMSTIAKLIKVRKRELARRWLRKIKREVDKEMWGIDK